MKVYKFYIKELPPDECGPYVSNRILHYNPNGIKSNLTLYAYTNNKKDRDTFCSVRNMDVFVENTDHMDKEEFVAFGNENRGEYLSWKPLDTKDVNNFGIYTKKSVNVLLTENEYNDVAMDNDGAWNIPIIGDDGYWWVTTPPAKIFSDKFKKELSRFGYQAFRSMQLNDPVDDFYGEYNFPDYWQDELNLFLYIYKHTLAS